MKTTIGEVDYYTRESDAKEALAVRYAGKRGPVLVIIPGMGDRSQGALENLINVVDGYDYDGSGPQPRQYAVETDAMQAMAKKYGVTLVTVTYPSEFNPNDVAYALDLVEQNYDIDKERLYIHGFSLGGGAVLRYITSSLGAADRLAGAGAAAPVNWATITDNVVAAGLQFIGTTYETDKTVSSSNVKNFVAAINARNPKLPAYLKVYPGEGHGGLNEILANEAYWQWITINSRTNRIPFTGGAAPIPTTPTSPTIVKAIASYSGSGPTFTLNGTASTVAGSGIWPRWTVKKAPDGVNIYSPLIKSSGAFSTSMTVPQKGAYIIEFALLNNSRLVLSSTEFTINYGEVAIPDPVDPTPIEKKVAHFDFLTKELYMDDSTIEKVVSATFKTESGKEYTI